MIDLTSRAALITGGAGGIGQATTRLLLSLGASVLVFDRADGEPADLRPEGEAGGRLRYLSGDVSDAGSAKAAVDYAVEQFGRLDILVNNAGITRDALLFRMTDQQFDDVLGTNLRGSFIMSRAAQAVMVEQRYGKIVMVSSRSALGRRGQANYAAAKAGMIGLGRTMAIELGPFGINVNTVAPGHIETAMTRAMAESVGLDYEAIKTEFSEATPMRRVGTPQDVANAIAFLASDAASYISGATLFVAGGPAGVQ